MVSRSSSSCIKVCETCAGSDALLCDLEDLCPHVGVAAKLGSCLDRCKSGPNCVVYAARSSDRGTLRESDRRRERRQVVTELWKFNDTLRLLSKALGGTALEIPQVVLHRARLRSDAVRLADSGSVNHDAMQLAEADTLLSEAIGLETKGAALPPPPLPLVSLRLPRRKISRLCELQLLRGELRGSPELARRVEAIADFEAVIAEEPLLAHAWMAKAKVLRRARQHVDTLACLREALRLGESQAPPPKGKGLASYTLDWIRRNIEQLEERLLQEARVEIGEFGSADAGDDAATDSGSGSGWWRVCEIIGLSWNTCIYRLENHPPAVPHPCPHDAWHVKVCFGTEVREYTPVSTATEWEEGVLKLVVKTYVDGTVSRRFAQLQQARRGMDIEEQRCWLLVSAPVVTLRLPSLKRELDGGDISQGTLAVTHLGLIVGGTGVAPALQFLREVANVEGAFGSSCRAALLYSSRSEQDVLMLDELRAVEAEAKGRVLVRHTLTNYRADSEMGVASRMEERTFLDGILGQHYCFTSPWNPFKPQAGPLQMGEKQGADFCGRVCPMMLTNVLPPPGPGTRIVISGPPQMWEHVSAMLFELGYSREHLVELKAFCPGQAPGKGPKRLRQSPSC